MGSAGTPMGPHVNPADTPAGTGCAEGATIRLRARRVRRLIGVICIVTLAALLCHFARGRWADWFAPSAVDVFSGGQSNVVESYRVRTALGDEFAFVTTFYEGFQSAYALDVYAMRGGRSRPVWRDLIEAESVRNPAKPFPPVDPTLKYDSADFRCYAFWRDTRFICKAKPDEKWFVAWGGEFTDPAANWAINYPGVVPFARHMFDTGQWHWVETFGAFLVRKGDPAARVGLQRYARGDFTKQELELNTPEGYSRARMQESAKQLLKEVGG